MAKTFQDRIKELQDYRPDIMYRDGAFILKIRFKKNWQIIKPKDEREVAYSKDDNVEDLHWYVSTIEDSDKIFDLIDETISINKEFEKKSGLYKEKVKELQELFLSDIPYDRLKAIQFVIPDKETKAKTKKGLTKSQKEKQAKLVEEHPMTPDESVQEPQIPENIKVEEKHDDTEYTGDIDNIIEQALGE
jgi:hypothetical protein